MLELCGSKNYPYLPHRRDLSLDPPTPPAPHFSGNSSQPSYIYISLICGPLRTPQAPRNFRGGRMDISWNY